MPVVVGAVDRWIETNHARRLGVVGIIEQQQLHAGGVSREDTEVDALRGGRRPQRGAAAFLETVAHCLPRSSSAHVATWSGSKPNFSCSALRVAEAPKVCMPMTRPERLGQIGSSGSKRIT